MVPASLTLPEGTPNVPLHRHQNLFWMRSRPTAASASPVLLNPVSVEEPAAGASVADDGMGEDFPAVSEDELPQHDGGCG